MRELAMISAFSSTLNGTLLHLLCARISRGHFTLHYSMQDGRSLAIQLANGFPKNRGWLPGRPQRMGQVGFVGKGPRVCRDKGCGAVEFSPRHAVVMAGRRARRTPARGPTPPPIHPCPYRHLMGACRGRGGVEADGRPLAGAFLSDSTMLLKSVREKATSPPPLSLQFRQPLHSKNLPGSATRVALAVDNIELLNSNLCANLGHLRCDLLSFLLGNSLFNRLGSLVNDRLGLFQAQLCNLTYNFDDVDLVGTNL